jgi:hypothetical protein
VEEASMIPTLPKIDEQNHSLVALFGSVAVLLGSLGRIGKNKKSIKKYLILP